MIQLSYVGNCRQRTADMHWSIHICDTACSCHHDHCPKFLFYFFINCFFFILFWEGWCVNKSRKWVKDTHFPLLHWLYSAVYSETIILMMPYNLHKTNQDDLWFKTSPVNSVKKLWGIWAEQHINPTEDWQQLWTGSKHDHSTPILSLSVMWSSRCPQHFELEKHKTKQEGRGGGGEGESEKDQLEYKQRWWDWDKGRRGQNQRGVTGKDRI